MAKSPQNILFISHSSGKHGGEKVLAQLVEGLDRDLFTPSVVLPEKGYLSKRFANKGICTHIVPLQHFVAFSADLRWFSADELATGVKLISEIIRNNKITLVHSNTSIIAEGAIAAYQTGVPHIWHLHEFLEGHPSLKPQIPLYLLYRFIDLMSEAVVSVSSGLAQPVAKHICAERLHIIPNGIEPLSVSGPSIRTQLGLNKNAIIVTSLGYISLEKGQDLLLKAALEVCRRRNDVFFLVAGDKINKKLTNQIEEQILANGLQEKFKLLGHCDNVPALLTETDIYVCPSRTESFGLALVEAMSLAKPVISSRCGGPDEVVLDGETGLLVPVGNVEAMAEAIFKLVESPETRRAMGVRGQKRYQIKYTKEIHCSEFEQLYASLKGKRVLCDEDRNLALALIELLTSRLKPHDEALDAVLNSLSWRITAPLRKIYDLLRK